MILPRDPETMTAEERRLEVASILAAGLLRRVRRAETANSESRQICSPKARNGLDLCSESRLSVAQVPVG